jgi:hypothetical protein
LRFEAKGRRSAVFWTDERIEAAKFGSWEVGKLGSGKGEKVGKRIDGR